MRVYYFKLKKKRYFISASLMESQKTWHFHNSEHAEGEHYSEWLHDSFSSWTHAGLYLDPKATATSQSGAISEPLKVGIVSRKPVTHISELRGAGNALQTLAFRLHSCPAMPHVNLDSLGKWREWAKWSRMSGDSNRRQLALSIYLHASVVPNWLPMS